MILRLPHVKTALIYTLFGVLWIFISDRMLALLVPGSDTLSLFQTFKGLFYVLITALLIFALVKREYDRIMEKEAEKERIFTATIAATHHIMNNFLNQMMLFREEGEQSSDFDPEVLGLYDQVIGEAQAQLEKLSATSEVSEESIKRAISPG